MMDRVLIEEKGWKSVQLFADMRNPKTSWYACPCPSSPTQATHVYTSHLMCVRVCVLDAHPSDTPACQMDAERGLHGLNAEGTKDKFKRLNEASK